MFSMPGKRCWDNSELVTAKDCLSLGTKQQEKNKAGKPKKNSGERGIC